MGAWFVERLLPGLIVSQLTLIIAYLRLHFEERWPYWGKTKKKDDDHER